MISQKTVNRNKKRLLKYTSFGSYIKKHYQATGNQYRRKTVKQNVWMLLKKRKEKYLRQLACLA